MVYELVARIKANLRRGKLLPDEIIKCSDIEIDLVSKRVKRSNKTVHFAEKNGTPDISD